MTTLLEIVLIVALGVSLAHWTWIFVAPRPVAESTSSDRPGTERNSPSITQGLFGLAGEGRMTAADVVPASKLRLLGVLSRGTAGSGRAILAVEPGRAQTVEAGAPIAPGYVLKEVHADQVLISHDGKIERLKLDRRSAPKK